jgi:hypothetical protein
MNTLCERCNKKIPLIRLKAIPYTRLCVKCSQIVGSDFEISFVEENVEDTVISKPLIQKKLRMIEPVENPKKTKKT